MIVSPKLRDVFGEIAAKTIEFGNTPGGDHKYIRRLVHTYMTTLTEDERVFVAWYLFENLHYKTALLDPETMLAANNIKLKTILFVSVAVMLLMITFSIAFDKAGVFGSIYHKTAELIIALVS